MSRVEAYAIDRHGDLVGLGEVPNAWRFHVEIWERMLDKHGLKASGEHAMTRGVSERLWSRVAKIPRADGLVVAATFDRCWFPIAIVDELSAALALGPGSSAEVGALLQTHRLKPSDLGVTFASSTANAWNCETLDGYHQLRADGGHACSACSKKIQRADHLLAERECCREPEDAVYRRQDDRA